jgi:predicted DNA binding protein
MIEAEFTVGNMGGWINDIAQKYLSTVVIVDCIPWRGKGGQAIFEIRDPKGRAPYIIKDIKEHPDIISIDINDPEGGSLRGAVGMHNCDLIRIIMSSGCFLEHATAVGDGRILFKVTMGSDGSQSKLFHKLDEMGLSHELQSLSRLSERETLTKKQEEVLRVALEKGYFDYPKRIKAGDLARLCGISKPTLDEILSRGQKNLLKMHFDGEK